MTDHSASAEQSSELRDAAARYAGLPGVDDLEAGSQGESEATALEDSLDTLQALGADQFQAARFHFICSLIERAEKLDQRRAVVCRDKARQALKIWLETLQAAVPQALQQAQTVLAEQPGLAPRLDHCLAHYDFAALQRLADRYSGRASGPLVELAQLLDSAATLPEQEESSTDSLADFLRNQERELLAAHAQSYSAQTSSHAHTHSHTRAQFSSGRSELRSARHYREAMQRVGASRLVERTVAESHPESGPLNPQMLATQTLSRMQTLSPAFSVRYVNYLQTLFSLDGFQTKAKDAG